jgi:hypothetical protein
MLDELQSIHKEKSGWADTLKQVIQASDFDHELLEDTLLLQLEESEQPSNVVEIDPNYKDIGE